MTNEQNGDAFGKVRNKIYDLEERTAKFGEDVIQFSRKIPKDLITQRIIPQLVGAGTSIGANYCEADDAVSPKDFRNKIGICKKESREAKHFLRMVKVAVPALADEAQILLQEARELNLIFNSIFIKVSAKKSIDLDY